MKPVSPVNGTSALIAATGSSVGGTIAVPDNATGIVVSNTSATLYVSVRAGTGTQTAVLGSDLSIPPMSLALLAASPKITHVAAIGSAAGPTAVIFTPVVYDGN